MSFLRLSEPRERGGFVRSTGAVQFPVPAKSASGTDTLACVLYERDLRIERETGAMVTTTRRIAAHAFEIGRRPASFGLALAELDLCLQQYTGPPSLTTA